MNSWFGEELRTIGADVQLTHDGAVSGSPHDLGLLLGAFRANDPAGALLTWRGWALGDRPTRLFERLPLAPLPAFGEDGLFFVQEAFEEPFHELDGRTGFYAGVQWDYLDRSRLRLQHYDNRGDALVAKDGQWAWRTEFDHLGWHLRLPGGTEVIAQAVSARPRWTASRARSSTPTSAPPSCCVSHAWGRQRASLRYDDFWVDDLDDIAGDPNEEDGHAWTAAWFLDGRRGRWGAWRAGVEALRVGSWRPARAILGEPRAATERSLQLVGEWRF